MKVFVAFACVNLVLAAGLFLMLRFSSRAIAIGLSTILVAHLAMPDEKLTTLKAVGLIAGEAGAGGRRAVLWD